MRLRAFIHHHSKKVNKIIENNLKNINECIKIKATPFAVHIFMLLGVTMYTIFGVILN